LGGASSAAMVAGGAGGDEGDWMAKRFEESRSHLRGVAYRLRLAVLED